MTKKLTPAQQQRFDLKQQHKDCLLLFRLGDFYELFHEDAHIAHKVLALTLTAKNKKSANPIPMAGIPYHALQKYLPKLVQAGYKVAIAEQTGKVVPGSVVKREIVEIITPGTYIEENTSENIIAGCRFGGDQNAQYHLAWGDYTLGQFRTKSLSSFDQVINFLQGLHPTELVIESTFPEREQLETFASQLSIGHSLHDHPFDVQQHISGLFGVQSTEGFGKALEGGRIHALSLVLSYIEHYQKRGALKLHGVTYEGKESTVQLDAITVKNLELFRSSYEGTEKHSLYGVINTCKTALGKRLLKERLLYPLRDTGLIEQRYDKVQFYANNGSLAQGVIKELSHVIDIPRVMSRILYRTPSPIVVLGLKNVLHEIVASEYLRSQLTNEFSETEHIKTLSSKLGEALQETSDHQDYGFIADGWNQEVDTLRQTAFNSDELLTQYHQELVQATGCNTLKIKFSKNQGYSIEVTKKDADALFAKAQPENERLDLVRVQSLKGGERFSTTYLQSLQQAILDAKAQLHKKEYELLNEIIELIHTYAKYIEGLCDAIATIDIGVTMSLRLDQQWVIPKIIEDGAHRIIEGRHPVVEYFLPKSEQFIPNDCLVNTNRHFHLITGPNMGGKSTYLRQNALILIMAHAGLPVPAKEVSFSILDGVYARVGSGDALAKNQSTFMTEMIEMANIVRNATNKSFIVLDELGRGTSTYDGMSLAKAICVYICQKIQAPTLFATHYHELTSLEEKIEGFVNMSVSVYETNSEVVFLKKIVEGGANKSYGLDVAKLAGIPQEILDQADHYLQHMGSSENASQKPEQHGFDFGKIDDSYKRKVEAIEKELDHVNIDDITPVEGLIILDKILGLLG